MLQFMSSGSGAEWGRWVVHAAGGMCRQEKFVSLASVEGNLVLLEPQIRLLVRGSWKQGWVDSDIALLHNLSELRA
jgi:hypothetical protein